MLLPVIFIIVLALLVLAGCVSFSTNIPGLDTSTEPVSEPTGENEPSAYEPYTYYVPATDEEGEDITNEEGSQIYVPVTQQPVTGENDTGVYEPTSGSTLPTQPNVPVTGNNEPTTRHKGGEATTVRNDEPASQPSSAKNDYDVFRSGTFYIKGSMRDSEGVNPLEMAITPDSIYMLTKFENVDMGILVSGKNTYLIYPAGKAYLELSSTVMKLMGLDTDELISSDDLGFADMEDLSKAERTSQATLNGKNCTVYEFTKEDGLVSKVYMSGTTLVGLESVENGTVVTATYIDSITANVPADKKAPSSAYEKKSVFEFMGLLTDVME